MVMAADQEGEVQQEPVIENGGDVDAPQEEGQAEEVGTPQEAPTEEPPASTPPPEPSATVSPVQQSDVNQQAVEELYRQRQIHAQKEWEGQVFKQAQGVEQQAIDELQQRRAADVQREWREKIGRTARAYEQQLQDQGYMPEQARDQARRYVQQEQRFQKQEKESSDMVQYVQGKQQAAVHFLKKHGLASKQMLDDFAALQQANTPAEMEREAQRMKRERSLIAENARLKQGRVAPQTFDNSQGSSESTTNEQRLLENYNNGDRSDAAVKAVRKLLGN